MATELWRITTPKFCVGIIIDAEDKRVVEADGCFWWMRDKHINFVLQKVKQGKWKLEILKDPLSC